jgi:hypothetical protein
MTRSHARACALRAHLFAVIGIMAAPACGSDAHRVTASQAPSPTSAVTSAAPLASTSSFAPRAPPDSPAKSECEPLKDFGELAAIDPDPPLPSVEDPSGEGMARFYDRLAALVRGRATDHVRIAMYGDSNLVTDFITGAMRRAFQKRFGDGGHGWINLVKAWNSYFHMDVQHSNGTDGWTAYSISSNAAYDSMYGFGLVAGESHYPKASTWIATATDKSPIGKSVSAVDVYYLKRPGFGSFEINVDGERKAVVDTNAPSAVAAFEKIEVPDGPHKVTFAQLPGKPVRLFGAVMERRAPSVTVDAIGAVSLTVEQMATRNERAVLRDTLAHRHYDLVIYFTGTNEWFGPVKHKEYIDKLFRIHREATPGVSILFMSPPDRVDNMQSSQSTWAIKRVAKEKREFSLANSGAFWDFRQAMGGEASMVRFRANLMAGQDLVHFNEKGGFYMGNRIVSALWRGFGEHMAKHPRTGCE